MPGEILYPFIAQGALVFASLSILAKRRLKAYADGKTDPKYFRLFKGEGEPDNVRAAQRCYHNQFEMPVLFFATVLAAAVFGKDTQIMVYTAWAYVAFRLLHMVVHLTSNEVLLRFRIFILSNLALFAMWIQLAL